MSQDRLAAPRREGLIPAVAQLIEGLPKPEQLVLALSIVEELTLSEIGTVLDLPQDRVLQLYTSAKRHLRTQLSAWRAKQEISR
jgi:RNA polymerase sigma factor (sigma-70 family)